ncbi:MAG: hypothetical protein GY795_38215 [Desulfobacterales bacterium]|nr:hypothetical protein [Desulfobacterales bacterium]
MSKIFSQMRIKSVIKVLHEIERKFDVNSLYWGDVQVWPLIRMHLWQDMWSAEDIGGIERKSHKKVSNNVSLPGKYLLNIKNDIQKTLFHVNALRIHKNQINFIKRNGPVDIMFFTRHEEHKVPINGKLYNHYIDPLIELSEEKYRYLKVGLAGYGYDKYRTSPSEVSADYNEPALFADHSYSAGQMKILKRLKLLKRPDSVDGFDRLRQIVSDIVMSNNYPDIVKRDYLDEASLINELQEFDEYKYFFTKILSEMKPKVVFLVVYYYCVTYALISAAKRLDIKTVDIQHCHQGEGNNLSYAHWRTIPHGGYELLPDFLWCWGNKTKALHDEWRPSECRHYHRTVIGGNRWLGKWLENEFDNIKEAEDPFYEYLETKEKVILATFQPTSDMLPDYLLAAMLKSPKNWLWLMRLHPLDWPRTGETKELIESHGIRNFEIEKATRYPLYLLLKCTDYHLSSQSTVAYESVAFNIPTIIIHPSGMEMFSEYINQGIMSYTDDTDELLELLNQPAKVRQPEQSFAETDKRSAEGALQIILKN